MDCSTLGFSVLHRLPEFAQTHVYDVIQLSHPLPSIFPSVSLFQQVLSTSGGQSIGASALASVLPTSVQGWFLGLTGLISLQSKRLSRVFSSTTIQKHQFFSIQPSSWSKSHIHMMTGKTIALTLLWHMLWHSYGIWHVLWHSYDHLIMPQYVMKCYSFLFLFLFFL